MAHVKANGIRIEYETFGKIQFWCPTPKAVYTNTMDAYSDIFEVEDEIPFFWWQEQNWLTMCNQEVVDYEDVVKT